MRPNLLLLFLVVFVIFVTTVLHSKLSPHPHSHSTGGEVHSAFAKNAPASSSSPSTTSSATPTQTPTPTPTHTPTPTPTLTQTALPIPSPEPFTASERRTLLAPPLALEGWKTRDGRKVTEVLKSYDDVWPYPGSVDLLVFLFEKDLVFLPLMVASVELFWPRNVGKVVVVAEEFSEWLMALLPATWEVRLADLHTTFQESPMAMSGTNRYTIAQYVKMNADMYSSADFIALMDQDAVLWTKVTADMLFRQGKPIVVGQTTIVWDACYHLGPDSCASIAKPENFMANIPFLVPRETLVRLRRHMCSVHGVSQFSMTVPKFTETPQGKLNRLTLSDFHIMGVYMWHWEHDAAYWAIKRGQNCEAEACDVPVFHVARHLPYEDPSTSNIFHSAWMKATPTKLRLAYSWILSGLCHAFPPGEFNHSVCLAARTRQPLTDFEMAWPVRFYSSHYSFEALHDLHFESLYARYRNSSYRISTQEEADKLWDDKAFCVHPPCPVHSNALRITPPPVRMAASEPKFSTYWRAALPLSPPTYAVGFVLVNVPDSSATAQALRLITESKALLEYTRMMHVVGPHMDVEHLRVSTQRALTSIQAATRVQALQAVTNYCKNNIYNIVWVLSVQDTVAPAPGTVQGMVNELVLGRPHLCFEELKARWGGKGTEFDVCGVNWQNDQEPMFVSNAWWANCDFLATLDWGKHQHLGQNPSVRPRCLHSSLPFVGGQPDTAYPRDRYITAKIGYGCPHWQRKVHD